MYQLFATPTWFNGWDLLFQVVSLVVALLISAFSFRIYRLHQNNKYAYFSFAFLLVAVGLLFKMGTSATLYFTPVRDAAAQMLRPLAGQQLQFSHLLYRSGFFLQMIPLLGAWLLIFFVSQKSRARLKKLYEVSQIALFIYLIVLISVVANFQYTIFYLTSAVILSLIVLNYYKSYLNSKNKNTLRVMFSFLFILVGNLFLIFVFVFEGFYAIGELFSMIGFLLLLSVYHKTVKK
jgi:hypothetical protein